MKEHIGHLLFLLFIFCIGLIAYYIQILNGTESYSRNILIDLFLLIRMENTQIQLTIYYMSLVGISMLYPMYCGHKKPLSNVFLGSITYFISMAIFYIYLELDWFGIGEGSFILSMFLLIHFPISLLISTGIGILISKKTYIKVKV